MIEDVEKENVSRRDWISLWSVLIVQGQNAFNDNFVKFILMGLAMAVAAGTAIGDNIEYLLAAMIPLPFILFAPVSGYLSDRFSKKRVIWWTILLQLSLFIFIAISLVLRSVEAAVVGFFFLAVQSTLFSPAKQGILKELVGSNRLGFANGMMSMLTMVGILGGMWVAGKWFDHLLASYNAANGVSPDNGWKAALVPVMGAGLGCLLPLVLCRFIEKTPEHPGEKFSASVWVRHFRHLKELFAERTLREAALFITSYWLVANFLGLGFVQFAKELYPEAGQAGRMSATAAMLFWVGGGLVIGSTLVSFLSRKHIQLWLSPLGALGMAIGLAGVGTLPPSHLGWNFAVGFVGFASGFLIVPLNAWLQDTARDDHRARVISALNLMTSLSGFVAIGVGLLLKMAGLDAGGQVLVFVPFLVVVAILISLRLRSRKSAA